MKKLRVFESISVDGYFTDGDGQIGWAHAQRQDPEFVAWVGGNANSGGELLVRAQDVSTDGGVLADAGRRPRRCRRSRKG